MNTIFEDQVANERASLLMGEINHTLDVLENIDDLMPSSSFEQKAKVDPKMKEEFRNISEYSIEFLDERMGRYKEEMNFIKDRVGDSDINYRNMADAITITGCKILQFQIGKISWFVNQRKFRLDKELFELNSELLYNIKRCLYLLSEFDTTNIGRNEVIKTDRTVINISKRLSPKSFFARLFNKFQ